MVANGGTAATFAYVLSSVSNRRISVSSGAHPPTQAKALRGGGGSNAREREETRSGEALRIFGDGRGLLKRMYAWATAQVSQYISIKALCVAMRQICEGRRRLFSGGEPRDRCRAKSRHESRKHRAHSIALRFAEYCQRMVRNHYDQRRVE